MRFTDIAELIHSQTLNPNHMKKTLLFKKISILFLALIWNVQTGFGQALLVENFDYASGSLLTANGWSAHSGAGTQPIDVIVPGLSFTGYPSSNIGGAAQVDNTGEDDNKVFSLVNSGSVYCAFLINVTTPVLGYFFHFGDNPISTTFRGKVFLDGTGTSFNFGLSKGSNTGTLTAGSPYTTGTTYLIVLKYSIISGTSNDEVSLFVFNGAIPSIEPVTPTIGPLLDATQTDLANVASIAIRQYAATQNFLIDGIRVATSWTDAISDINPPEVTISPANAALNVPISTIPTITFNEPVRKTDGTVLVDTDLASLLTFKKTDASGANVPFSAAIDAAKKVITITPTASLDYSQVYYIAVGPVEDLSGNESVLKSTSFTTAAIASPVITLTYPIGGERMYAGQAVTITWTSANIANVFIEVWVPTSTPGVFEWISYIASTPGAPGTVSSSVPLDASYGTDYKIRISDLSNPAVNSVGGNFTIIGVASTLAGLRTNSKVNDIVKYTGTATVTYARTSSNQKYIQDATGAILIHDPSGYITGTYIIGDGITNIEGKITLYNGLVELVPQAATGATATGTAIVPPVVDITTLTAVDQCKLIKVKNLRFATPAGNFTASTNYDLAGLSNTSFVFRTAFSESDYIGTVIPADAFDAVVLVGQYNAVMQVTPRNLADITLIPTGIGGTLEKNIRLYPVPASTELNVSNIQNVNKIEILDVTGKIVMTINSTDRNEIKVPVSNLTRGLYFIKFTTEKGKLIKRFIKS
jgi:hypothetical protein